MPTAEEQVFTGGADLTPTFGANAALIEQAIELAITTSYRGLVIYSDTTPTTSGEPSGYPTGWYEWHKRCLWLKPSTGEIFRWNGTTWALAVAKPGSNTIGTSALIDNSVTIAKLNPSTGQQYQVIRVNAGETAFEYIDASDLFGNNEIDIAKISGSSLGSYVLTRNATSKAWTTFDSATIINLFGANEFPIDSLARGSALQVPMVNSGGTAITWTAVLSGIADYTVPLTKLSKTVGDAGKWLRIQADGSVQAETLTIPSPTGTTFASSSEVAAGTETSKAISPATASSINGLLDAHGSISCTGAAATLVNGTGIASVAWNNVALYQDEVVVTLTTAQPDANYRAMLSLECAVPLGASNIPSIAWIESKTTTQVVIRYNVTNFINPTIFHLAIVR